MFGLTKREQRWKAEQKQIEVLAPMIAQIVVAALQARVAIEAVHPAKQLPPPEEAMKDETNTP